MILITQIVITRPFPFLLDGRLYQMQPDDVLSVRHEPEDRGADVSPGAAKELLRLGLARLPGHVAGSTYIGGED